MPFSEVAAHLTQEARGMTKDDSPCNCNPRLNSLLSSVPLFSKSFVPLPTISDDPILDPEPMHQPNAYSNASSGHMDRDNAQKGTLLRYRSQLLPDSK